MYVSLSEVQIKREDEMTKHPLSQKEVNIPSTPVEVLYQAMLSSLPQYMVNLK